MKPIKLASLPIHKAVVVMLLFVLLVAAIYSGLNRYFTSSNNELLLGFLAEELPSDRYLLSSDFFSETPFQEMRDYLLQNDLANATRVFRDHLRDLKNNEDACGKIHPLFELASLFSQQDLTYSYIRTKRVLSETIKECHADDPEMQKSLRSSVLSNLGLAHLHLGLADTSHYFFQSALSLQEELIQQLMDSTSSIKAATENRSSKPGGWHQQFIADNNPIQSKAVYRGNLGRSQLALGDTLAAIESWQESIAVNGISGFKDGHAALISLRLANLFTEMNRLDEANLILEEASQLIIHLDPAYTGLLGHKRYQEALWKYHDKKGNTEEAYNAYKAYNTIFQEQQTSRFQLLRLNVHMEYLLNSERQQAELLRANSRLISALLFISVLLLIVLSILLYTLMSNKKKMEMHAKLLEATKQKIEKQNQELSESKDRIQRLTMTMAHDLRSPLSGIKLLSHSILEQEQLPDHLEESLRAIHLSSEQTFNLLEQVLLTDSGVFEKPAEFKLTEIKPFLRQCIAPMKTQALKKNQELTFICSEEFSAVIDSSKFCRVIQNLTGNAIKHNPEKTRIVLNASLENDQFLLQIRDNGAGIAEEKLATLFNYKKQAYYDSAPENGSFGMGLFVVDKIVRLHNGILSVESSKNGTTFSISLPLLRNQIAELTA